MNNRLLIALALSLAFHLFITVLPYTPPKPGVPETGEIVVQLTAGGLQSQPDQTRKKEKQSNPPAAEKRGGTEQHEEQSEPVEETEPTEEKPQQTGEESSEDAEAEEAGPEPEQDSGEDNSAGEPGKLRREPIFRRSSVDNNYRAAGVDGAGGEKHSELKADTGFEKFSVSKRKKTPGRKVVVSGTLPESEQPVPLNTEIDFASSDLNFQFGLTVEDTLTTGDKSPTAVAGELPRDRLLLENPLPEVPGWLEESGDGKVRLVIAYRILPAGEVEEVTVITSSGYPELDSLVVEHLRGWVYEPAAETERRTVEIQFRLDPGTSGESEAGEEYAS